MKKGEAEVTIDLNIRLGMPSLCSCGSAFVLLVADVLHPVEDLPVKLLLDGDVRHSSGGTCAEPMLFAGREPQTTSPG
jgi:hypothetical protein